MDRNKQDSKNIQNNSKKGIQNKNHRYLLVDISHPYGDLDDHR